MTEKLNLSAINYEQPSHPDLVAQAFQLMEAEYQTNGGNLKDKSPEELNELISSRGQLWVASQENRVIATHTIEAVLGDKGLWLYLNNGVVASDLRHQSSGVMDQLLKTAMTNQTLSDRFFVISVVWGMFERLGFKKVTLAELAQLDPTIASIVTKKIRPGTVVHLGIKEGIPK